VRRPGLNDLAWPPSGATSIYAMGAGALMGAAIPALLYVLTQVGAAAWIDCGRA
jgi:hypothetical protein